LVIAMGFEADPQHSFPGHGQMKPEQLEIAQLKREVTKAEGGAGHPKKSRGVLREGIDMKFAFIAKHRGMGWLIVFPRTCTLVTS
jgi:hypothetical protein